MKLFLDSIGCRLNQSEIEAFAIQFRAAGHDLVSSPGEADLVVVNTCAVTAEAASDSRQRIRQAARAGAKEIAVTGCWSSLYPADAEALSGVTHVVSNQEKDGLVAQVLGLPAETFDLEPVVRTPVPGTRLRTRAFIKAQDGCDNHCTFCITTVARGASRSRPVSQVIHDIRAALDGGAQEIVLTGVHLGSWGHDLGNGSRLKDLVLAILAQSKVLRLRMSSLEPWDLDEDFFALWEDTRLCRQLHLPLQSGSAATLRRMARKTRPESFAALVESARRLIPEVAITTDVIVGFPGESDAEFQESLDFVREMGFAGGHVFTYSARPGTAAARFSDQVPMSVRKQRNREIRAALAESARGYRSAFLGRTLSVLWEAAQGVGPEGWEISGLTDNYLRVSILAPADLWNQITPVLLTGLTPDGLHGTLVNA